MGPDELDIFFRRMVALGVPKASRLIKGIDQRISIMSISDIQSHHMHCHSKVLILLALLVSWMDDEEFVKKDFEVIEYFAGCGRIALLSHYVGYQSAAYDLDYGSFKATQSGRKNSMDLNSNAGFCLAIKLILRSRFDQLIAIFAVCCSSFVPVNRGTGQRDLLVAEGDENIPSVRKSNKLLSRNLGYHINHFSLIIILLGCSILYRPQPLNLIVSRGQ